MAKISEGKNESKASTTKNRLSRVTAKQRRIIGAMYRPLCKILILIGVATMMLAVVIAWQFNSSSKRTELTTGTITEVNRVNGISRTKTDEGQKCRIHYKINVNGYEYSDTLGYRGDPTAEKCSLNVDEQIQVTYDPDHPANNAYQADDLASDGSSFGEAVSSVVTIMIVGIIPLVLGIMGLNIAHKRHDDEIDIIVEDMRTSKPADDKRASNHKDTKVKKG